MQRHSRPADDVVLMFTAYAIAKRPPLRRPPIPRSPPARHWPGQPGQRMGNHVPGAPGCSPSAAGCSPPSEVGSFARGYAACRRLRRRIATDAEEGLAGPSRTRRRTSVHHAHHLMSGMVGLSPPSTSGAAEPRKVDAGRHSPIPHDHAVDPAVPAGRGSPLDSTVMVLLLTPIFVPIVVRSAWTRCTSAS